MNGLSHNFEDAVSKMSQVLSITGKVLPVTTEDVKLKAKLSDGSLIEGESRIGLKVSDRNPITKISIEPEDAKALNEVLKSIKEARAIILGPGSLFTSVIPNLLIKDVAKAIKESNAIKIYVCNIMTQPGETDDYTASMHLKQIHKHADIGPIDYIITNNRSLNGGMALTHYLDRGSKEVKIDTSELNKLKTTVIEKDILEVRHTSVRHDPIKLANCIMEVIFNDENVFNRDNQIDLFINTEWKRIRDDYLLKEAKKQENKLSN